MKVIPVPREPEETREMLSSGYDLQSINRRYKDDLEDIKREYSLMALLKGNANIVYCDDICDEPNSDGIGWKLYIRMELLTPLSKVLTDPVSEAQVLKVGMDLCNALAACKRNNIIHRDIKPANIMVARDGNFKLGDFGVAKTMEGTSGGTKTGTYNFMAPEVYNNRPYGQGADIYSLGMVLYWMLNRRCGPFLPLPPTVPTASQMESAKERRFGGEQLPPPANGSQALKQIVLRACAFNPAQRYSSPEELYADLADIAKTLQEDRSYRPASSTVPPSDHTVGDRSNSWENEYDKTQGSVYSQEAADGGTVGDPKAGGASKLGPFDVRGIVVVTQQELATGCVKRVKVDNALAKMAAKIAPTGSAASLFTTAKIVEVTIPAGTRAGAVLRLTGAGRVDTATGAKGNAYITVTLSTETSGSDNFWGEQSIDGEVTIPSNLVDTGWKCVAMVNGKKYFVQVPANVTDGQIITVEGTTSGEPKRRLTLKIHVKEVQKVTAKKKTPWGAIIWIALGFGMLTVAPPLGIGWIALGIPFLFIGKKKS